MPFDGAGLPSRAAGLMALVLVATTAWPPLPLQTWKQALHTASVMAHHLLSITRSQCHTPWIFRQATTARGLCACAKNGVHSDQSSEI